MWVKLPGLITECRHMSAALDCLISASYHPELRQGQAVLTNEPHLIKLDTINK
jgi:hypothetical protein